MAQRNQALYSYEKTVRGAFKEVNDSLDAIGRYGEQLSELQAQEKVAQRRCASRKTAIATVIHPIWTYSTPSVRCFPPSSAWYR